MPWSKAHEGYREEAKYAATWLGILQNFPSEFTRRDAVQPCKKSLAIDQVMNKKIKRTFVFREITKRGTQREKRGWFVDLKKPSSVRSSQRLLQVSARNIYTGRSELPTCGKWLLLPRREKLIFIKNLFLKSVFWSHVVMHFINYSILISIHSSLNNNTRVALWRQL